MVKSNNRILWIDGLKYFAILLVVWGHVLPRMGWYAGESEYSSMHGFIYSFHMPLFMTLSGFVSYKIVEGKMDIPRKFRQLIVPCVTLFVICAILRFNENFWYLKSLFLCYLIWGMFFKIQFEYKYILLLVACLILFPAIWHVPFIGKYKVDFMLPFFGVGLLLKHYYNVIRDNKCLLLIIAFFCFIVCELMWDRQFVWYNSRPNWIDYNALVLGGELFHLSSLAVSGFRYLTGIISSFFFIVLFMCVYDKWPSNKCLLKVASWGGYSLHIYILQAFLVRLGLGSMHIHLPWAETIFYDVIAFIVSIFVTIVSIEIAKILQRSMIINRYLFGKF